MTAVPTKPAKTAHKALKPLLKAETAAGAQPTAAKRSREQQFKPSGVTHDMAWRIMKDEEIASVPQLVKRLKVDGIIITERRLRQILSKNPGYRAKFLTPKKVDEEVKLILEVGERLSQMAEGASSRAMHGLYMTLIKRLAELVPQATPDHADGLTKLFALGQQITALMHDLRGLEINQGNTPVADDYVPDLMDLANVLPIRKPGE